MSGMSINIPASGSVSWKSTAANSAALPASGNTAGDARVTLDNNTINIWSGSAWVAISSSLAVVDTASVDLTFSSGSLQAVVLPAGVSHNSLAGLTTGDSHTQYALLAGRSGGQTLIGGTAASNNLLLQSTSNGTKGRIRLDSTLDFSTDGSRNIGASGANRPSTIFLSLGAQLGNTASISGENDHSLDFRTEALGSSVDEMAHMALFQADGGNRARLQTYNHGSGAGMNINFHEGAGIAGCIGDFGSGSDTLQASSAPQNIGLRNLLLFQDDGTGSVGQVDANRPNGMYAYLGFLAGTISTNCYVTTNSEGPSGPNTTGRIAFGYSGGERSCYLDQATGDLIWANGTIGGATEVLRFKGNNIIAKGAIGAGLTTIAASAQLQADSTTKGFLPPRMTTTQKNAISSPATGLVVFDTTLVKLCVYNGVAWETVTSI